MLDLVTLGESMALFLPKSPGALGDVRDFSLSLAGAESNVAIGMARLGFQSGWISRVGEDGFGRFVVKTLRGEGVDVSQVTFDPGAPTGLLCRENKPNQDPRVYYYRQGSAASRMGPSAIDPAFIAAGRLLHVTGITLALSPSCQEAVTAAIRAARLAGRITALDPNLRLKLWSAESAAAALGPVMAEMDLVLIGLEEGERLSGRKGAAAVAAWCLEAGCRLCVVKLGERGAMATDGKVTWRHEGFRVTVVDTVGAGDAFAAGFYAAWLDNRDPAECLRYGNAAGALAVQMVGDTEGLPYREDLLAFLGQATVITR